jgi:hypothetical protein
LISGGSAARPGPENGRLYTSVGCGYAVCSAASCAGQLCFIQLCSHLCGFSILDKDFPRVASVCAMNFNSQQKDSIFGLASMNRILVGPSPEGWKLLEMKWFHFETKRYFHVLVLYFNSED